MAKDTKTFQLVLPKDLAEDFYRCFPERGQRTILLRKMVARLVMRVKEEDDYLDRILEEL